MISVRNLRSTNGNTVPNQFVISTNEREVFQSYDTQVAMIKDGVVFLTDSWDYSNTTLKYLKQFLHTTASKKEIQRRIDTGEYKMIARID